MAENNRLGNAQSKAEKFQKKYKNFSLERMVRSMAELKVKYEQLEEEAAVFKREYDFLSIIAVPAKAEEKGIESIRIAGVGRLQLDDDMYVNFVDRDRAIEWLEDNGHGNIVRPDVHSGTLRSTMRGVWEKAITEGDSDTIKELEELFKFTPFQKASIHPK